MNIASRKTSEEAIGGKFFVLWETEDTFAQITVHKIAGRDAAGLPLFDGSSGLHTGDTDVAEVYLEGFIKFDGEASLDQAAPHWEGLDDFKAHTALLRYLYERAFDLMGREPGQPWEDEAPAPPVTGKPKEFLRPAVLEDDFAPALMGITVAHDVQPRMAYSLNKIAEIEKRRSFLVDDESARRRVWDMIQDITRRHGDRAPVFIDDAAFAKEEPKVWTPNRN